MASMPMNLIYTSFAGLIGIILILWFYFKLKFSYWKNLKIKYVEPVPIFGNVTKTLLLLNNYQEAYHEIYKAVGDDPYVGYYEMNTPILMVRDPELVHSILVTDFKHFHTRGRHFVFIKNKKLNPLSLHLGSVTGERWRFLRHSISPVFTAAKLKQMQEKLDGTLQMLETYLEKQMNGSNSVDVEVRFIFERVAMNAITSQVFGTDSKCSSFASSEEFLNMMHDIFTPKLVKNWHKLLAAYFPPWLNNILNRAEVDTKVIDYFKSLALDSVEYRRQNGIKGNDILQVLMDLQNSHADPKFAVSDEVKAISPKEKFDEVDIVANIFILLLGGYESSSSAMSHCLYELALNENVQQNLRNEIQKVKDEYGKFDYDSLKKMSYLDATIAETLRKYSTGVALNRVCTEDYVIPGTDICLPKGTSIKIPVWSIHHDWKYFPNPEKFDPGRFLGENKNNIRNGTYLPFGDGPRACVGKRFAQTEVRAALANLILKYEIRPCEKTEIPLTFMKGYTVLQPNNGIWVNMTRRQT